MIDEILTGQGGCYICPVRCKREVWVAEPYQGNGGPAYETIATSGAVAFAMECYENGILGKEDTGGLELEFGNTEAVLKMVGKIARTGVKYATQRVGPEAISCAMHVKCQSISYHEPRGQFGLGLGYAVPPTGAEHLAAPHDPLFETEVGLTAQDDVLPDRFCEPLESENLKGSSMDQEDFQRAVKTYYGLMGWDDNGVPTSSNKLAELDIAWAEELSSERTNLANNLDQSYSNRSLPLPS